ncbi:hypothetical protein [Pontibacter fetidus]|uniref:DUF5681 domain-containing protein n=1 Tax=Pontibacter fetidus TaxID=2700082 RepID=A0A6B2H7C1_9BACT|nr:hypothetical protein [Pontibacter fetidus]NDK56816.1 hypothetical protein [Pontibacter fetidus]
MGLKKGMTNNPGGRPLGTVNKVTRSLRERINAFLEDNFILIEEDFKLLDSKERTIFYTKLLAFGLPTLKAIDYTNSINSKLEGLSDEQLNMMIEAVLNDTSDEL